MKYMGSKNRISKDLLAVFDDVISKNEDKLSDIYIEPFVGGANMIDKIGDRFKYKFGYDSNKYLIALLVKMQEDGFSAPVITKEEYEDIKNNKHNYDDWLVGFAGFQLSFGSLWFGSYRRDNEGKRDYSLEAKRNIDKQSKIIKDVTFEYCRYALLDIPWLAFVYCDPPYRSMTQYEDKIDHDHFWEWVRGMSETSVVLVSEYNAPDDFECIWQKEITTTISKDTKYKKGNEKLFVLNNSIKL